MHGILHFFGTLGATLAAWGPWGILLLTFIDSVGIPVSVGLDALVILLGVKAPQTALFGAALGVLGSTAGNLVLFLAARRSGRRYVKRTEAPGRVRAWFQRYGLLTVFIPALVPIPLPLKVFVISAGVLHVPVASFLSVVVAARAIRYFGEAYLGMQLGEDSANFLGRHAWELIGAAAALFIVLYLLLRLAERRRVRS
jgi:membrane protein YqaA with SNARE-associated domain